MPSKCYIYCRSWYGFTANFPFYAELNALPDDILTTELTAGALTWLRQNKRTVRQRYRAAKLRLRRGVERRRSAFSERPGGLRSAGSHRHVIARTAHMQIVRGDRRTPVAHRIARLAGWWDGSSITGLVSPTPAMYLGSVPDEALAQDLVTHFRKRIETLQLGDLNLQFSVRPRNELGSVEIGSIRLQLDELPTRNDELAILHREILAEYTKLVSRVPVIATPDVNTEGSSMGIGPRAASAMDSKHSVKAASQTHRSLERLTRARRELARQLREIQARWVDDNRDPSKLGWFGIGREAAELAATLGFRCPPIEFVTIRRPAPHPLLDSNPKWEYLCVLRVHDPIGITYAECPLMAGARRVAGENDGNPAELLLSPAVLNRIEKNLKSWCRLVDGLDLANVRSSVSNYSDRQDSLEILGFRYQLARELQGRGDRTREEEAHAAEVADQLRKDGAEALFHRQLKDHADRFRTAAVFKPPEVHNQPNRPAQATAEELPGKMQTERGDSGLGPTTVEVPAEQVEAASSRPDSDDGHQPERCVFKQEGEIWTVVFQGSVAQFKNTKGLAHIHYLLANAHRDVHVTDLARLADRVPERRGVTDADAREQGLFASPTRDLGPILDDEAKKDYRRRLEELDEEIRQAKRDNDLAHLNPAEQERDILVTQLTSAIGKGGKDRKADDELKRMTDRVCANIRNSLQKIREYHEPCWRHLKLFLNFGEICRYSPDNDISWEL